MKIDFDTQKTFACYADNDATGMLLRALPEAIPMAEDTLPSEKPRLAIIQLTSQSRKDVAWQCARKKIPFALADMDNGDLPYLKSLSKAAARNKVPAALLNSWRFIPAVAAMKEIVSTGCLGTDINAVFRTACNLTQLDQMRLMDALAWLTSLEPVESDTLTTDENDIVVKLHSPLGNILSTFTLDGERATMQCTFANHSHERVIPKANPFASELNILALSTKFDCKIRKLNLMMPLY